MNTIKQQFDQMLGRGVIPHLEYELVNGDYLTVEIEATASGLQFSADFNDLPCFFDGQITGVGNFWLLPYDDCFSLDEHLQLIDQNIREGYLIVHNLELQE